MSVPSDTGGQSIGPAGWWRQLLRDLENSNKPALVEKGLLLAVLFEILLGGNGYLTKLGDFRLREMLFGFCIAWVPFRLFIYRPLRLEWQFWALMLAFVGTTAFSTLLGYFGGSRPGAIVAELKPLSYFFMLPFFAVAIRERADVVLVSRVIIACGVALALAYLAVLAVAYSGLVRYTEIYSFLRQSDEFIFRHHPRGPFVGFLYKGSFHVCVALIFLLLHPHARSKILASLLAISVAMTLTRGLAAAIIGSMTVGAFMNRRLVRLPATALQMALLIGVLVMATQIETQLLSDEFGKQTYSDDTGEGTILLRPTDSIRMKDIATVLNNLSPSSVLVGHGLGSKIGERERIEMNYLELLAKQGLLGLALWGGVFLFGLFLYMKLPAAAKQFGLPFFLALLFVFLATTTNTFLTGSIGMSTVFIALAALSTLRRGPQPVLAASGAKDGPGTYLDQSSAGRRP